MGVTGLLTRVAANRPHVFLAEGANAFLTRSALQRELRRRDWVEARSAADADVLIVIGTLNAPLSNLVNGLYEQMPGPRVRTPVLSAEDAPRALDQAQRLLLDIPRHVSDVATRTGYAPPSSHEDTKGAMDHGAMDHGAMDHGAMDHGAMDHGAMDHGAMDHGAMDHGAMDHGAMAPAGIPLASGGQDRDGLEMDELNVRVGPLLPHWPAALVAECVLHGDLVTEIHFEVLADDSGMPAQARAQTLRAAQLLDAVASTLVLAGSERFAQLATSTCDAYLDGSPQADAQAQRLRSNVASSRVLRRVLGNIGDQRGDLHRFVTTVLDEAIGVLPSHSHMFNASAVDLLKDWGTGRDISSLRLLAAALKADFVSEYIGAVRE